MKSILSVLVVIISSLALFPSTNAVIDYAKSSDKGLRTNWLTDSHRNRIELFKKWLENKPIDSAADGRAPSSPYDVLHPTHQFKGACCFSLGMIFNFLIK